MTPNDRTETGVCRPLERRYRCPSCWQRFYFKPNLDYHMQRKHGTGQQPAQPDYDPIAAVEAVEHYEASAKALDALDAQPGSGEVKRYTPNSIANEIMAEDAWHDSQWVRAADHDRLQSTLEAAQQRNHELQMLAWKWMEAHDKLKAGEPYSFPSPADLPAAQQRIAELESELENERARGIHTCHDQCERPLCVAQRRTAALESGLSEAIEIMTQGERLLPKGEARFRLILEDKEPS